MRWESTRPTNGLPSYLPLKWRWRMTIAGVRDMPIIAFGFRAHFILLIPYLSAVCLTKCCFGQNWKPGTRDPTLEGDLNHRQSTRHSAFDKPVELHWWIHVEIKCSNTPWTRTRGTWVRIPVKPRHGTVSRIPCEQVAIINRIDSGTPNFSKKKEPGIILSLAEHLTWSRISMKVTKKSSFFWDMLFSPG
jgi:hypothetical protein